MFILGRASPGGLGAAGDGRPVMTHPEFMTLVMTALATGVVNVDVYSTVYHAVSSGYVASKR
jgi:hypothetical protein